MKLYLVKAPMKQTYIYHVRAADLGEAVKKYHEQTKDCSRVCIVRGWYNNEFRVTFEEIPLKGDSKRDPQV